jgi:ABC-type branched-subunit amino acid transport system substrate-binding protein
MSKFLISLLLSLSLATPLLSANAETGVTDNEILLGTANVLSGSSEFYGRQTNIGIKALVNSVNDHGGINGRKIRVISEDDRYEQDGAIASFQKLSAQGVFGIAGLVGSAPLAKYLPMSQNNKLPIAGFYPGPIFVGDPVKRYAFTARASYRDEMRQTVDHLWKDMNVRKIAVIFQNDSFGADLLEGVKTALQKYNAEMVAVGSYTRNKDNVAEAVEIVRKANPEAVIFAGVYHPCAQVAKLAHDSNWNPIFVLNSGTGVDAFILEAGSDAEGKLVTEVAPPISRNDLPLIDKYTKALGQYFPKEKPNFVSLRGYIDALIWIEGLKRAGKHPTRESFVDGLERLHNQDVGLGKGMDLNYSSEDHLGFHNVFFGIVKNGQVVSFNSWKKIAIKR